MFSSTLHQVTKYINQDGKAQTLVANKMPLKVVENYYTDEVLYEEDPRPEEPNSSNEADIDLELAEE